MRRSNGFQKIGKALFDRQQRRENQMRFRLVAKRHRRKIVAASIGMAMFNRHPESVS